MPGEAILQGLAGVGSLIAIAWVIIREIRSAGREDALTGRLMERIDQQDRKIDALEKRNADLDERNEDLDGRLDAIEADLDAERGRVGRLSVRLRAAIASVLDQGYRTRDIMSDGKIEVGTQAMGDKVLETFLASS